MTTLQRNGGVARTPFLGLVDDLVRQIDRDFVSPYSAYSAFSGAGSGFEVEERDDAWLLSCDVPGVDPKELRLQWQNGEVSVRAERHSGSRRVSLHHAIRVPEGVDVDRAEGRCERGVLTIRLPKSLAAKPRAIPITASTE